MLRASKNKHHIYCPYSFISTFIIEKLNRPSGQGSTVLKQRVLLLNLKLTWGIVSPLASQWAPCVVTVPFSYQVCYHSNLEILNVGTFRLASMQTPVNLKRAKTLFSTFASIWYDRFFCTSMVGFFTRETESRSQILEELALVQVAQTSLPHSWVTLSPATAWLPASACLYVSLLASSARVLTGSVRGEVAPYGCLFETRAITVWV